MLVSRFVARGTTIFKFSHFLKGFRVETLKM
ncbi:hypothetical protein A2U01_0067965, partial [Trifolium medium]|nr:hypothetical protein [Trifolium medium]